MDILNSKNKGRKFQHHSKTSADLSTMVYGKFPPQARDLEEAILGIILLDQRAFDLASEILSANCFYVDAHQKIFETFQEMRKRNTPIDMLTIVNELKKNELLDIVGGPYYIASLTNKVTSSANIETWCMIVLQQFLKREVIRISSEFCGDAYEDGSDALELLDQFEQSVFNISSKNIRFGEINDMLTNSVEFIGQLDQKIFNKDKMIGVASGFHELDECTFGWQKSDFIILAARPSVGKTCLAINFAVNAAINSQTPIGFFSLEMSKHQITERITAMTSGIALAKIRRGRIDEKERAEIDVAMNKIAHLPIFIDDTASMNWLEFRAKARRLVAKRKLGLIIIDYLQLMSDVNDGQKRNREQQLANISREIKKLAKEINIPIIALSQLSRDVEKRGGKDKIPVLSDLRDSGAIEQDADIVAFIYRPEYYEANFHSAGETFVKIAKHRSGTLETIKLIAKLHIQKFYSSDDQELKNEKVISDQKTWAPLVVEGDPNFKFS